jgi:hypothetical protein
MRIVSATHAAFEDLCAYELHMPGEYVRMASCECRLHLRSCGRRGTPSSPRRSAPYLPILDVRYIPSAMRASSVLLARACLGVLLIACTKPRENAAGDRRSATVKPGAESPPKVSGEPGGESPPKASGEPGGESPPKKCVAVFSSCSCSYVCEVETPGRADCARACSPEEMAAAGQIKCAWHGSTCKQTR